MIGSRSNKICLLFSVLNKILRVGASGWFMMNQDSVQKICRPSPWREGLFMAFSSYHMVQIRGEASVLPPTRVFPQQSGFAEVIQCALDGGAGKPQLQGNGLDSRPAAALAVRPVFEVHIHTSGPVAQIGSIDIEYAAPGWTL